MDGAAWDRARNLLCVRLDSLGDVLMTTPAIRALRESASGRSVTLLTSPAGAAVARLVAEIDEVLVYEAPWLKATPQRTSAVGDLEMVERLRTGGFDGAVIFTVYSQNPLPSALLCYLADIPLRLAHCRENPYQLLTDWVHETEPESGIRHEVRRQLDLVGSVGCRTGDEHLSLRVPDPDRARVAGLVHELGIDRDRPWAVVHPGASAPSRRYPPEHYARVIRHLQAEHGWEVVLTGTVSESTLVDGIAADAGVATHRLAGKLTLGEMAALIEAAPIVISNNTGPAHIAAAVGTPVVDLYALTNLQHTPWGVPSRVLYQDVPCRLCYRSVCPEGHHQCLRGVAPEAVIEAARELVGV